MIKLLRMTRVLVLVGVLALALAAAQPKAAPSAFAPLVDEYLEQFAARHPSIAAGNGLHQHDDRLEDFSAGAVKAEVDWLTAFRGRVDAVDAAALSPDERVDRRILQGLVDAWLLDLGRVKTWQKNPMIYASAISDGVHDLMTMESAPAAERMRNAAAKLRAVPRLLQSARENIRNPPRLFVERGVVMLHGASALLDKDLPLAFAGVKDAALQAELRAAAAVARAAIDTYSAELDASATSATGSYVVGTANLEARYRDEELIDLPASALLAIGRRELDRSQREFTETAARVDPSRRALDVWRAVLDDHPKRGELAAAAQKTVDELLAFVTAKRLVDLPPGERVIVAPAPEFDLGLASMHSSPPLEAAPGEELLLRDRCARRLAGRAAERVAAEVQLPDARHHHGARGLPGPLRAQPVHAEDAGQDSPDLDRAQSVPAALVGPGRLGALCRTARDRSGIQERRPALQARRAQRGADENLPADRRHRAAHGRVDRRSGGRALREGGAPAGAGGAAGGRARHLRSDLRRLLPRQDGRAEAPAGCTPRRSAIASI